MIPVEANICSGINDAGYSRVGCAEKEKDPARVPLQRRDSARPSMVSEQ
jgi:hypothetical protein